MNTSILRSILFFIALIFIVGLVGVMFFPGH